MNIKSPLLRWSVAVLAVLMLTACGSPTSTPTTSAPASGDSITAPPAGGDSTVQKTATGQVTFTVQFPQSSLKKALIDERTVSIYVQWYSYYPYYTSGSTLLTPDSVTGLATAQLDVPVGYTKFMAIARDSNGNELDITSSAGEIITGNNIVYLTFLSGDWQFVDADDNPLPQSFGTTTLAGFSLKSGQVDGDGTEYQMQWQGTEAAIGPLMWAGQVAQFNASPATGSSFGSDWLNLTDPTRSDSINGNEDYQPGDRLVWVFDWEEGDGPETITDANNVDLIPQFRMFGNTQVLDGNHIGGHLMAMTFENYTETILDTNVDCDAFYNEQASPTAARAAAIKASLSKAAGKAAIGDKTTLTADTITVKFTDCYDNTTYDVTEQFSNVVASEFRAKGSQAATIDDGGGSATPPPAAFSMEWLNGKALYQVWYGEGYDSSGNPLPTNVPVVAEVTFDNGTITYNSLLNGGSGGSGTYAVDAFGMLYTNGDTNSGNTIVSGSTDQYIKTHYTENGVIDNVDLFFYNESDAMAFASTLTASIP